MQFLKADTAATVVVGPLLAIADGYTSVNNATLGAADSAEFIRHDGAAFIDASGWAWANLANGFYTLIIPDTATTVEGRFGFYLADEDNFLPVWVEFMVVNANVYDSMFAAAATDYLKVDMQEQTAAINATMIAATAAGVQDFFTVDSGETAASAVSGSVVNEGQALVTVNAMTASGAQDFFTVDSGETQASDVSGSVVYEMRNSLQVTTVAFTAAAVQDLFTVDSGETQGTAVSGSLAYEVQQALECTVTAFSAAGVQDMFTVNSGETFGSSVSGSVVNEIGDQAGGMSAAQAFTVDSGLTYANAVAGSVVKEVANFAIAQGAGPTVQTYTLTDSGTSDPIADALVVCTSDEAGTTTIASGRTNASGVVSLYPDVAASTTVYLWRYKTGYTFTNPDTETTG